MKQRESTDCKDGRMVRRVAVLEQLTNTTPFLIQALKLPARLADSHVVSS